MKQSTLMVLFIIGIIMLCKFQCQYPIGGLQGFRCYETTKLSIAIRINTKNRIECLSSNGRTCIRGLNDEETCRTAIEKHALRGRPIRCSGSQINSRGHWCSKAYNYYFKKWHCPKETGIQTAIKLDPHTGNSMCLSLNGKDCLFGIKANH